MAVAGTFLAHRTAAGTTMTCTSSAKFPAPTSRWSTSHHCELALIRPGTRTFSIFHTHTESYHDTDVYAFTNHNCYQSDRARSSSEQRGQLRRWWRCCRRRMDTNAATHYSLIDPGVEHAAQQADQAE